MNKLVSVVLPAHNESETISVIIERIEAVFEKLSYRFEIIIIDDGSTDDTLAIIKQLAIAKSNLYYIQFSKNFGHQPALKAGLDYSKGDCVISLDADLQHPPEFFIEMLAKWEEGYEVVYTRRQEDKNLSYKKRKSSAYFYKLLNSLSDVEIEPGTADFRLMDKKVVNVFAGITENDLFIRGLVKWVGFKQFAIDYVPNKRYAGASKYTLTKMRKLAVHGVTSLSVRPLHLAVYLGFGFSCLSILYIPYVIYAFYSEHEVSGWASIIMTIVFFGGLQLIILGVIGIYIGKMFMQTKLRPSYIISSHNLKNNDSAQF